MARGVKLQISEEKEDVYYLSSENICDELICALSSHKMCKHDPAQSMLMPVEGGAWYVTLIG